MSNGSYLSGVSIAEFHTLLTGGRFKGKTTHTVRSAGNDIIQQIDKLLV